MSSAESDQAKGLAAVVLREDIMANNAAVKAAAPTTVITKFRALILVKAVELGWTHTQVGTRVDQYKKGTEVITMSWGATQLNGFSHTKGKSVVKLVEGTVGAKLQKLQTQLGDPMEDSKKWPKLSPKKVEELEALAATKFLQMDK